MHDLWEETGKQGVFYEGSEDLVYIAKQFRNSETDETEWRVSLHAPTPSHVSFLKDHSTWGRRAEQ